MNAMASLNRMEELFHIIRLGLYVLWIEARWLAGPDIVFQRRLSIMRRRQEALQNELARLTTLADPKREQLAGDLALLDEDIERLDREREEQRAACHAPIRRKFAWML